MRFASASARGRLRRARSMILPRRWSSSPWGCSLGGVGRRATECPCHMSMRMATGCRKGISQGVERARKIRPGAGECRAYGEKATGSRVLVFFVHELKTPPVGAKENLLLEYGLFVFVLIGKDGHPLWRQHKRSTLRWAGCRQTLERRYEYEIFKASHGRNRESLHVALADRAEYWHSPGRRGEMGADRRDCPDGGRRRLRRNPSRLGRRQRPGRGPVGYDRG